MKYGQFCPISKASEVIGEKWTILILRELLMGGSRFSELQRGLGTISPTLLTRRLGDLEDNGLLIRKKIQGQKGYEYFPTDQCQELLPVIMALGEWGMRWTRHNLRPTDCDVGLLMLYLERSILPEKLPGKETVIQFSFTDMTSKANWWLVIKGNEVDACDHDPGRDVDLYFTTTLRTMIEVWTGTSDYKKAIKSDDLSIIGPSVLTGNITSWMSNMAFADIPSASEI